MRTFLRLLLLAGLLLTACSTTPSIPTASIPPAATSAASAAPATSAPPPTSTSASTPTAVPATTAAPASLAPATAVPATATSATAPAAINPLTGLPVIDPTALDRRPLAIKIAHFPRGVRAAQSGLSVADNIWEHYAEGGTTRFTAIFLSQGPDRIGNVRSARLIDTYLGQAYQAILVASGSSDGTMNRLRQTDFFKRVIAEATGYKGCPILCREAPASETADKLFTSGPALWALASKLGFNGRQDLSGFAFDAQPPVAGTPIATAHLDWQLNNTVAEWRYDPATRSYARWIDTASMPQLAQQVDSLNSQALSAANVVVVYAAYVTSNIHESDSGDKLYFSYDIELYGSGPARLFRDGQMYELTWTRDKTQGGLPRFTDAAGNVVPFRPGQTWFEAVSTDSINQVAGDTFSVRVKVPDPVVAATAQP